jgi:hypothetical protein
MREAGEREKVEKVKEEKKECDSEEVCDNTNHESGSTFKPVIVL